MTKGKKAIVWIVAIIVVLIPLTYFGLDYAIRGAVADTIRDLQKTTGREIVYRGVDTGPYTITAIIHDLEVKTPDKKGVFLSISTVRLSKSLSSYWKGATILNNLSLESLRVNLARTGPNRYNFSDMIEHAKAESAKEKKPPTKFFFKEIAVDRGKIDFDDQALPRPVVHTVRDLEVRIPFVGNMAGLVDKYETPKLYALVDGAPLGVKGMMKPFADSQEASVAVKLQNLNLPPYQPYVPAELPVKIDSGKLSTDLVVAYTAHKDRPPDLHAGGTLSLADFFLRDDTGAPLFALKKGATDIRNASITTKNYDVNSIILDGLEVWLAREANGTWSHSRLTAKSGKKKEQGPEKEQEKTVANVTLTSVTQGKIHFSDHSVPGGFSTEVGDISFLLGGYSTLKDHNGPFSFSCETAKGLKAAATGDIEPNPLEINAAVNIDGLQLRNYYPYAAKYLRSPVKGTVSVSGDIHFDKPGGLRTEKLTVAARDVAADFGGGDGAKLSLLELKNIAYQQQKNDLSVEEVLFDGGRIDVTRFRDGKISAANLLKGEKKGATVEKPKKNGAPAFRYRIGDIALRRLAMNFRDQSPPKEVKLRLRGLQADLRNVTGPKFATMPFRVSTGYAGNGRIEASGTILPDPLHLKGVASVANLPVKDFDAYLPQKYNVVLADGKLTAKATADIAKRGGEMTGSFSGNAALRSFQANDAVTHSRLLAWESIDLRRVQGKLGKPLKVVIDEIVLNDWYADVAVNAEGNLNLAHLVKKEPEQRAQPVGEKEEKQGPPPDIRVNTITVENGVLAFSDEHLKPPYSTKFVKLGGRISGLTSEPGKTAGIDLRGSLENHSPLRISGEMNPLATPAYLDLRVSFDDIELPRLTPYSATFLGYRINQGKLNLDLRYRVEGKKLDAQNRVFIDQLTLGQKVPSERATNLPVPAAVSLLKNKKGEINLDVPVTGRTDSPKFSFWDAVKQAFRNTFLKLFTNPFASLFGGEEAKFRNIYFDYGDWRLSAPEKQKLDVIAAKIAERPGLELDVMGFVDRERDPEPYRQQLFLNSLRFEKFIEELKGPRPAPESVQIPESLHIEPGEFHKYLKLAYRHATFPKPDKELSDEEMKKLMLAHTIVDDTQLRELSRLRSLSVRDYLASKGIPQARLFLKMGDIYAKPEGEVPTAARVSFSLPTGKSKE